MISCAIRASARFILSLRTQQGLFFFSGIARAMDQNTPETPFNRFEQNFLALPRVGNWYDNGVHRRSQKMRKTLLVLAFSIVAGCTYPDPTGYKVFGVEKLRQIKQDPERYVSKLCAFGGLVVDAEKTESRTVFRILVQDEVSTEADNAADDDALFVVYPSGKTTVADGHHVRVLGYIREPAVGKDLFGSKVASLTLDAVAVYDAFTGYPFRLSRNEELFRKWKTGEPLNAD
jgi:hypothetical protein